MIQDRLDRIWKTHKDGLPAENGTGAHTSGDGDHIVTVGDKDWRRKGGKGKWEEIPRLPMAGEKLAHRP